MKFIGLLLLSLYLFACSSDKSEASSQDNPLEKEWVDFNEYEIFTLQFPEEPKPHYLEKVLSNGDSVATIIWYHEFNEKIGFGLTTIHFPDTKKYTEAETEYFLDSLMHEKVLINDQLELKNKKYIEFQGENAILFRVFSHEAQAWMKGQMFKLGYVVVIQLSTYKEEYSEYADKFLNSFYFKS